VDAFKGPGGDNQNQDVGWAEWKIKNSNTKLITQKREWGIKGINEKRPVWSRGGGTERNHGDGSVKPWKKKRVKRGKLKGGQNEKVRGK